MAIGSTAYGNFRTFNLNSLYQPDAGTGGPTNIPMIQEMTSLYGNCKVMAVELEASFMVDQASLSTFPLTCYLQATAFGQSGYTATNTLATWQNCEQFVKGNPKYCVWGHLGSPSGNARGKIVLKKYWNLRDLYANSSEFEALTEFDQPIPTTGGSQSLAANPTATIQAYVGYAVMDGNALSSTTTTAFVEVRIKYYTKWWTPKQQIN